ncbi:LuxR C-terminal-related transcriptional regulator [Streptomyces coffeae]|uniref:Helix-turn-helix transcriptional regulator n=1 Tax=Streptomyces coffeae TaxID=621382 RepID=A0ABS1NPX3_9ACTN|nr:helix-turn-helix transcriptional regulator [Streptomyces coffeae]MBL1102128.1 helix-turn-helix transcriptional regulator [Streptomyces coffeae]
MEREREWDAAVREPLASAGNTPALVLVEGAAGTGKSRFVDWLLAQSKLGRAPRLTVTFTSSGAFVAQEPTRPAGAASAVKEAGPTCRPGGPQTGGPVPPRAARLEAASLAELAASPGTGAPVVLVAEDMHRANEQDARALRSVLAHPPAGLLAVLTYRPEELAHPGLVLGARVGYPAGLTIIRLRLGPLSEPEVRRMAVDALGEDLCSRQFITRLHERSGGIAQVVADLAAELRTARSLAGGTAKPVGRGRLTARDADEAAVPVRLTELVLGRMAALDEEPQRVAKAAAVLDGAATEKELTFVAALPEGNGRTALTATLSGAVLHEFALGQYGFCVPAGAAAVHQLIPGPVRREMHERAAEALVARRPVPWALVARQHFASGRIAAWLGSVEKAAHEAIEAGNHQLAISLLEDTLARPVVQGSDRARLALMLARSASHGPRSDRTVEVLEHLVDDPALPAAARGEIRLGLGLVLLQCDQDGQSGDGRAELVKVVEELSCSPALAARAMSALALPYWPRGSLADSLAWLARAEATVAESGDAVAEAAVAANRAAALLSVGDPDGWRHLEQLPRDNDDLRILRHSARGLANAASAATWLGEYPRAHDLLASALKLAARNGQRCGPQATRGTSLLLNMMTGHWAGLPDRARTLLAEADEMPYPAGDARLVLGLLALARGEWCQAGSWLSGAGVLEDDGPVPRVVAAAGGRIRLALARQDLADAAREAAEGWARLRAKAVWVWAAELAPWAVEAIARAGQLDTAREMVDEFAAGIKSRQAPAAAAALTSCRAVLAEADGERRTAVEHFRHARTRYQALPRPYEAALAAEAVGRCTLGDSTDTAAGISELTTAADELYAIGATWDVARVRAELRSHPSARRRPPGRPSYGDRLSPREQETAELAGAGMSNREIASALHLSPRTVEQHVARAIKKLGVASRHALGSMARNGEQGS